MYKRRVDAARWLASGTPRMEIVAKLKKLYNIETRQAHIDINVARSQILPAIHDLGEIEDRVSEGLARVENHYQMAMSAGQWGAATQALKMLLGILGCQADQVLARERLDLERTAYRLREMALRREENKVAQVALSEMSNSQLATYIDELKSDIGSDDMAS